MYARVILLAVGAVMTVGLAGQSKEAPKVIWEKMLDAKGGRDRLHSVETLVVLIDGRQERPIDPGRAVGEIRKTSVYRFPDQYWLWEDTRPSRHDAFSVTLFNDRNREFWFSYGGGTADAQRFRDASIVSLLQRDQLLYLLETQFIQPVPVNVSFAADAKTAVVEVTAPGFAKIWHKIDSRTYLPVESAISWWLTLPTVKEPVASALHVMSIEAYSEVAGLKLPSRIRGPAGALSFMVNPKIDPTLFEVPPHGVTDRDSWKRYLVK